MNWRDEMTYKWVQKSLYTLKVHLPNQVVDDAEKFGCHYVLGATSFERCNEHGKRAYWITSQHQTVCVVGSAGFMSGQERKRSEKG